MPSSATIVRMKIEYTTIEADHDLKAVEILRRRLSFSSQLCKKVRLHGELLVDGKQHRMIDPVPAGSFLEITYQADDELEPGTLLEEKEGIRILYQDDWLVVADKPPRLLTHPSFLGETEALTTKLSDKTLHPVSRLDRDTSGLIILGKNGFTHDQLARQDIQKCYIGFVHGIMPAEEGIIDAPIARSPDSIITREVRADGQSARTRYRSLATMQYENKAVYQIVSFELETGRTHQIRVHCKWLGHTLIGDSLYLNDRLDAADLAMGRQALHAISLEFAHPLGGESLSICSTLREDMKSFIRKSRLIDGFLPEELFL